MKKIFSLMIIGCSTITALAIAINLKQPIAKRPHASGAVTEGFQLSARAEEESILSGAPATLRVRIKNRTKKSLYLAEAGAEMDYKVTVYSDSGRIIPLTEHGKALANSEGFMINVNLVIKPGEEREDLLDVK
jgi:hypothetical protein